MPLAVLCMQCDVSILYRFFFVGLQPFDLLTTSLDSDFPLFHAPFKEEKKLSVLAAAALILI